MGGTDDPSNLITVTPEQHANLHRILYEVHGHWQDYSAWKGLSGQSSGYEIQQMIRRLANLGKKHFAGKTHSDEYKKQLSLMMKERRKHNNNMGNFMPHTDETKNKISDSLKGNSNKKGKTGYKLSEETKEKMSEARKGDNNPSKRADVREKLRQAALLREAKKRAAKQA
jgi:hypothetical protein